MDPYARYFADRLEGLLNQLLELKGFARTVPPLIQAERERVWAEAEAQSDEYREPVYIYDRLSGPDTGGGFAKFDHAVYSSALNLGWDTFVGFLQDELLAYMAWRFYGHDQFAKILTDEERRLRDFGGINRQYKKWFNIDLEQTWPSLKEVREVRNAVVHNFGCYTAEYLRLPSRRYPTEDMAFSRTDDDLLDQELIPLDESYVRAVLDQLGQIAGAVRQRVLDTCPEGAHWIIGYRARWLRRGSNG